MVSSNSENKFTILKNVRIGKSVTFGQFVNVYGCTIDDFTKIGSFVEIQKNSIIGKKCKISSHSFICEGVEIGDEVFIGHGVMFTNDKYPKAVNKDGSIKNESDWEVIKTYVKSRSSIGSNATILPGVTIGKNALIGAGAIVTKDVPPNGIVVGNQAQISRIITGNK